MAEDPLPIGKVLQETTRRLGMGGADQVATLFSRWAEIVGPAVAEHVEPVSLRQGVLKLRTGSPAWATEIAYLREQIRTQVNGSLGAAAVQRVEVVTGPKRAGTRAARPGPATTERHDEEGSEGRDPNDPIGAFERAFAAWQRRRSRARRRGL